MTRRDNAVCANAYHVSSLPGRVQFPLPDVADLDLPRDQLPNPLSSSATRRVDSAACIYTGSCIYSPNPLPAVGNFRTPGPTLGYSNHSLLFLGLEL